MHPHPYAVTTRTLCLHEHLAHVTRVSQAPIAAKVVAVAIPWMIDAREKDGNALPDKLCATDSEAQG